jgi:molecular chaperone DnaK (HSP70)
MKYIIGIDLGTTNSAVTYIDLDANKERSSLWREILLSCRKTSQQPAQNPEGTALNAVLLKFHL